MGVYNPHAPRILGQEFVPIRNEGATFSPSVNLVEQGHRFRLSQPRQVTDARFYVKELPPGYVGNQVYLATVYPTGLEDKTGPINSVVIPCNNGSTSGSVITGGSSLVQSLASPGDGYGLSAAPNGNSSPKTLDMFFNTSAYAQLLTGKRILAVNFLYQLAWDPSNATNAPASPNVDYTFDQSLSLETGTDPSNVINVPFCSRVDSAGAALLTLNPPIGRLAAVTQIAKRELGEVNHVWANPSVTQTSIKMPWRYEELARFEATAGANRYRMHIEFGATNGTDWAGIYEIGYAALEVIYCEEQRVAYGGGGFGFATSRLLASEYNYGANVLQLRDPATLTVNPVLPAGEYTVAISSADIGDLNGPLTISDTSRPADSNTYPTLNSLRELYPLTSHIGVQVNVTNIPGEVFSSEQIVTLPQVTLHASGGPLTEVHVYGQQAVGQVYGSNTVTQEILDSAAGGSASFPWVRFYARRFGTTTIPLTLTQTLTPANTISVTASQFDALDELVDGWKEVTLRFISVPVMGAGTTPQFTWSATGELKGNRWEVLGATAPAVSGVPGNWLNLVPSPNQLSVATYGQPSAGSTVNMGWLPQYAPPVSAASDDATSDAVLLFAQDMPTVTGFSVASRTQTLTGIGLDCLDTPEFVPDGIGYNWISWTPTSSGIPVSGFGSYELQRMDTLTDWQTIMTASSPATSGFADFEARIGISTSYRMRSVDVYDFPGPWSSTVTTITPSPGVSGTSITSDSQLLAFTTNARQDGGSNLAYCLGWEGEVVEDFNFPEASGQAYQTMYNRDFVVAFRPLERGGTNFTRTLLIQAAAISPPTLEDFTSIRDMAWDDVPYICVRDEEGNRWFANVSVPAGKVVHFRSLYLASIAIVQVTETAAPVDPSS
jgi:hypothetical protein